MRCRLDAIWCGVRLSFITDMVWKEVVGGEGVEGDTVCLVSYVTYFMVFANSRDAN